MSNSAEALSKTYSGEFFEKQYRSSLRSAAEVFASSPELFSRFASILDVGCGAGAWLAAAKQTLGVSQLFGVDHPGVANESLLISTDEFFGVDIATSFDLKRNFDLVVSVEVGEHILSKNSEVYVDNICRHGDVVLFSAAVPLQGGTAHVNEQWPRYWEEKFANRGYQQFDVLRPVIWENDDILFWYRQNIFIYSKDRVLNDYMSRLRSFAGCSLVHPGAVEGGLGLKASGLLFYNAIARRLGLPSRSFSR